MTIAAYAAMLLLPFLFSGIINRIKAIVAGRKGQSLIQPFFDVVRLLKKGEVRSETTSYVFWFYPAIALSCTLFAGLLVPTFTGKSVISFEGDFVLFTYMLGLSKFLSILSAMDTGSSFEAMGASREGGFSAFVEPAFFIILGTFALASGATTFESIVLLSLGNPMVLSLVVILSVSSIFLMVIIEGCRVPVDDPNTHLELTMIHEVMVLDNSGPGLGFIGYAASLKMTIFSSLIASVLAPLLPFPELRIAFFFAIIALVAVVIGILESVMARMRMTHVPQFVLLMTAASLIALFVVTFSISGGLL
jgi:formate hydrogenlyase subunit 4